MEYSARKLQLDEGRQKITSARRDLEKSGEIR
jgi:hypothetical protein